MIRNVREWLQTIQWSLKWEINMWNDGRDMRRRRWKDRKRKV